MCGSSDTGVRYARADLFENATYFLCTTGAAFPKLYEMLQEFILELGARPTHIDAVAHDRIMAVVSHLPHVLANVLMDHTGAFQVRGKRALHCVGPSFKDLTRVAGANPAMWSDIFLENRSALAQTLRSISAELARVLAPSRAGRRERHPRFHRLGGRISRGASGVRGHHSRDPLQGDGAGTRPAGGGVEGHDRVGAGGDQHRGPHPSPLQPQRRWRSRALHRWERPSRRPRPRSSRVLATPCRCRSRVTPVTDDQNRPVSPDRRRFPPAAPGAARGSPRPG